MTPLEFLQVVLPSQGQYVAVGIGKKGPRQTFHYRLDSLLTASAQSDAIGVNAYYALASFGPDENRTAANARLLRSCFLDVDVGRGKEYSGRSDATVALATFVTETGLPLPLVVSSGYGIHVYWPFTSDVPTVRWLEAAARLKALCIKHRFSVDYSIIEDAARVLRVPGTHNYKNPQDPKGVRILGAVTPPPVDFEAFCALLGTGPQTPSAALLPGTALTLQGAPPTKLRPSAQMLVENTKTSFLKILKASVKDAGCMQLKYFLEHAQDDGVEPLWRSMLSLAKSCYDGEEYAKQISALHPYSEERRLRKWEEIKGPYTCTTIERLNPGHCTGCIRKGQTNTPLMYGTVLNGSAYVPERRESVTSENISIEPDLAHEVGSLPHGFSVGSEGGVFRTVTELVGGQSSSRVVPIIPFTLAVATIRDQDDSGGSALMFADMPGGRKEFLIPTSTLMSKAETLKALAYNGVLPAGPGDAENALYAYVRSAARDFTYTRPLQNVPDTYGWQKDGSFVLNNRKYGPDGSILNVPTDPKLLNLHNITSPKGNLSAWQNVIQMIVGKNRPDILLGLLVSFGAPLMSIVGNGLNGLVLHLQSHDSGTGKSVSLELASSVYGHPQHYGVSVGTSDVAAQYRMGMLHSLPWVMDEVTSRMRDIRGNDQNWINRLLMDITQGKGKERLEGSTITERKNITTWETLALMSSNTSIIDALTARAYKTEGEFMRLLEIGMHEKLELDNSEAAVWAQLNMNYGTAGAQYIRWLVRNTRVAKDIFKAVKAKLQKEADFKSDERFWLAGLSAMMTGGILADSLHAGVVNLPMTEIARFVIKLVKTSRRTIKKNDMDAKAYLSSFIQQNYGKLLVLKKENDTTRINLGLNDVTDQSLARGDIKARIEVGFQKGTTDVFIDRKELAGFCSKINYSSAEFQRHLSVLGFQVRETMKSMFANTRIPLSPPVKVVSVSMSEERFRELYPDDPLGAPSQP
jgi:hypothetical protein